jgi:hypothetical protein
MNKKYSIICRVLRWSQPTFRRTCRLCLPRAFTLFLTLLILEPWIWRPHVRQKCRVTFKRLHCVTSQSFSIYLAAPLPWKESWRGYRTVVTLLEGRAIAQAVSRRLSTATDRVRIRVRSCGICGGQSGTGTGFLRVLRFPLPIRIPQITPQSSSSIIWGWHNRPNSGRSTRRTQSHPMRKKNNTLLELLIS